MPNSKNHYRTIFISDTHLGSRTADAATLLDFLRHNKCEKLVIVGDFLDFWALNWSVYFPAAHREVLRLILKWSARGVEVVYVPGNHDEAVRAFLPIFLDNVSITKEAEHSTVDGRQFLITHGDAYDQVMKYARWLAFMGDVGYHILIHSNHFVNFFRRKFGYGYWSLSNWAKQKVKTAVNFIGEYEQAVVKDVVERGYDGVVCGHIHKAELRDMHGITYVNCGDWVESCTALVEDDFGNLSIVHWQIGFGKTTDNLADVAETIDNAD
jgi:UDP-2,3-diacylglucosamine pyrophosphatase LpxH